MPAGSKKMRYWVDVALECVRRDHTPAFGNGDQRGPFLTARALGMALGALHDGRVLAGTKLLSLALAAPSGAVTDADIAGAAACHQVLLHRYPEQTRSLNAAWDFWVRLFSVATNAPSENYGRTLGDAVHLLGLNDRQVGSADTYSPGGFYTHDVPPSDPGQGFAGSEWGNATHLVAMQVSSFAPPPGRVGVAPVVPTAHFAADFQKVQTKGAAQERARTTAEEVTGIYWGYDGPPELGTPPRLYMQIVLAILDDLEARRPASLSDQEELQIIAATGLAMSDAGIDAWHYKYSPAHMMWRPVLGIPHGLGGLAAPEPGWEPLGRPDTNGQGLNLTPNFPAYPSGHATFGAAAFQLLRTFLVHKGLATFNPRGLDNVAFDFASDEYNGRNSDPRPPREPRPNLPRKYGSLWNAITDNSISRLFLGVHWQFDGVTVVGADPDGDFGVPATPQDLGRRGGVWLGCQIANQVALKIGVPAAIIAASKA